MIDESNQVTKNVQQDGVDSSFLNLQFFIKTFLLNWQWILLSVFICLAIAVLYIRYTPAVYQITAKILVKEDDNKMRTTNKIQAAANLGFVTNSDGFDNELEVLRSVSVAEGVVRDLKLYVNYEAEGRITDRAIYKDNPVIVDLDPIHLDTLNKKIYLEVTKNDYIYNVRLMVRLMMSSEPQANFLCPYLQREELLVSHRTRLQNIGGLTVAA